MPQRIKIVRAVTVPMSTMFFVDLIPDLQSLGYYVVSVSSDGSELQNVRKNGAKVIVVPMERRMSPIKDLISLCRLIKVFYQEQPYMVHSMTPKAGLLCMVAAWITRVPRRIHTFTGLVWPTSTGMSRRVLMLTDKITCLCATHIIPEGFGVMNDLQRHITKKPMHVLGYGNVRGIDMEFWNRTPEVMQKANELRRNDVFTFLFVGRIVKSKGINELIEAYEELHKKYPATRLWLVGPFEDNIEPIEESARKLIKEDDSINAFGEKQRNDMRYYYAASDCYVFPSYREGIPNTVLEAGALGLPSIVTDINGSREIITNTIKKEGNLDIRDNGIVIPSHDVTSLYNAMELMLTNTQEHQRMADNARNLIATRYEQSYIRKCLYDFYEEIK